MTYFEFILVFVGPFTLISAAWWARGASSAAPKRELIAVGGLVLIALVFTTPWDNYLVANRVWWYPPDRVLATIWYVPLEEYCFMVLQSIATGLITAKLFRTSTMPTPNLFNRRALRVTAAIFAILAVVAGLALALGDTQFVYMSLILVWAAPVGFGLLVLAGRRFFERPGRFALAVLLPTVFFSMADIVAIDRGIWTISPEYTLGVSFFGVPIEEAVFFAMTNFMVAAGTISFLPREGVWTQAGLLSGLFGNSHGAIGHTKAL